MLVDEMGGSKGSLVTAEHASKQRREALDEAKRHTAELDTRIEGLNAQLSPATREREEVSTIAREAESSRALLAEELDTTRTALLNKQELTAQLRIEIDTTETELQVTLTQIQQELQSSQQANAAQATAHNLQTTELRGRIDEMETQLAIPFSKKLKMRAKKLVKRFGNLIGVPGRMK